MDIGCGNGRFLSSMRKYGWQTYGIEKNPKAVEDYKSGNEKSLNFEKNHSLTRGCIIPSIELLLCAFFMKDTSGMSKKVIIVKCL